MTDSDDPLIAALAPITSRVRTSKTAIRKASGAQVWTKDPLTDERLARHLNGGPARGVCPLREGSGEVELAVLDFDSHKGEVSWEGMSLVVGRVVEALTVAWGASPVLFRSTGGAGVHLYLLWARPQDARSVRLWLAEVLAGCGLRAGVGGVVKGDVEVFPKQDRVEMGGSGNQFILPMAGKGAPLRWCDLSGMLEVLDREVLLDGWTWGLSEPVALREAGAGGVAGAGVDRVPGANLDGPGGLWAALDAIPNGIAGSSDLSYDQWQSVVLGVHWETGGDPAALERVREWSMRSGKHTDAKLDKDWGAAKSERGGGLVTGGSVRWLAKRWGWVDPADTLSDADFGVVPEDGLASAHVPRGTGAADGVVEPVERRGVPRAQHLCTDQANAVRLVKAYGARVLVAAGRWHVWDGRRWKADEGDVYRFACRLSGIIKEEAAAVRAKAREASLGVGGDGSARRMEEAEAIGEALDKWGIRTEMKGSLEAAVGLARKMLTVEVGELDRDPGLLNCRNGVVDLRTGGLREHRSSDLMTKLADVVYVEGARSEEWERVVLEICGGRVPVAGFLRRWFGYCATGLTREQVFVVHWGDGANGKSTVIGGVSRVLGDYAGTAAPGLLVGGEHDRHPTEIADLAGKRMVTAHETKEGVQLREDFVKQATGDDKMKGRFMREDFFDFMPTHKLQLLTNAKPVVKGQDHGIWRRVRLVKYGERFGSEEDVAAGLATRVRDRGVLAALASEGASASTLSGVLGWVVRGAVEWFAGGLQEPDEVIEAGEAYRMEQDRVRQWALECCEIARVDGLGAPFSEPLTLGMSGLFPSYQSWCRESGYHGLGRQRFLDEILRAFPGLKTAEGYGKGETGARRKVMRVIGVRLLPEG